MPGGSKNELHLQMTNEERANRIMEIFERAKAEKKAREKAGKLEVRPLAESY